MPDTDPVTGLEQGVDQADTARVNGVFKSEKSDEKDKDKVTVGCLAVPDAAKTLSAIDAEIEQNKKSKCQIVAHCAALQTPSRPSKAAMLGRRAKP